MPPLITVIIPTYKKIIAPTLICQPELLDNTLGILYNPSDPQRFQKVLSRLINSKFSIMAKLAKKKASELGWDKISEIATTFFYRQISNHE